MVAPSSEGVGCEMEGGGGGRRVSSSPRPCCGRRVVAKKKHGRGGAGDGFINNVRKLQRREISTKSVRGFSITDAQERFRDIRLKGSFSQSQFFVNSYFESKKSFFKSKSMMFFICMWNFD
jgi:hypothetical protein